MSAKKIKRGTILSPDTFFYTIPLERSTQRLTRTLIDEHYPVPGRKAFMGNRCEYIGYVHGILSVNVFLNDTTQNTLSMHVGTEELHIACTCGMPGEKLCRHAYMGLHSMTWRHYLDFRVCYWPGYETDEKIQRKFLQVDVSKEQITVEPKLRYGNIFRPGIGFPDNKHISVKEQTVIRENNILGSEEVMSFCLCYSFGGYYSAHLPVLASCPGVTSKDHKQVVSFLQFGTKKKPINKIDYSSNQALLYEISLKQYDIAKHYDGLSDHEKRPSLVIAKQELFDLWQQALPLVIQEKFCYTYYTYWLKYLNDKPRKSDMKPCRFSMDKPVLCFVLKFHGDHFSVTADVSVNGERLEIDRKPHFFVIDRKNSLCYFMQTVQDDDLLMWVLSNNKRLTILKEHFVEFHDTFLKQVSICYDVIFVNKSGKKKKYVFHEVLEEIA